MKLEVKRLLSQWYSKPLGLAILQQEKQLVDGAIRNLFGYFLVQLDSPCHVNLMTSSRIQDKVLVAAELTNKPEEADQHYHFIKADLDYLPIGNEKADVVLLPHTLEIVDDPYYLLREVDRILVAEGHVVITGFNPYGCLMMRKKSFKRDSLFKAVKLERLSRVKEWLEVLGYDIELQKYSTVTCFAQRDDNRSHLMSALEWVEKILAKVGLQFGNVYCLVAKKRVDSVTLVGSSWKLPKWRATPNKGAISLNRNHRVDSKHK
ncbi:MAG: hypothetical protein ISEC1_P1030 [Thiomicrorhabdus sp.]|nr:MAG: hypothetical protein ISEC1_P1030 [Thiomicrorhabdus sp.]